MGGQSQHHFSPESAVVRGLETKLADSPSDLASRYQQLRQDPAVVLALRYLTLAVIASELNLYGDHRSAAVLVDEISQQMNATNPNQLLTSIRYLKLRHQAVYSLNPFWFDRAATSAVDCINHGVARRTASPVGNHFDFESKVTSSRLRFDPEHPPHTIRSFSWRRFLLVTGTFLGSGLAFGVMFNLDRLNFPHLDLAWATAQPQNPDSNPPAIVTALPSPAPSTPTDSQVPILVESSRHSISPIPTVMGMSQPLPATTAVQPTKDSSQFIAAQLSAPFYQKVVSPETAAQPNTPVNLSGNSTVAQSLQKICGGRVQICSYGFKKQAIIVTLLPNYTSKIQQVAQAAAERDDGLMKIGLNNHIQSLNNALASVGQHSAMPLELHGSNGQLLQKYLPKKSEQRPKVIKIE